MDLCLRTVICRFIAGAIDLSTDDLAARGKKLLRLLRENQIDLNAVEVLRPIAFSKIKDSADRRVLIELRATDLGDRFRRRDNVEAGRAGLDLPRTICQNFKL